MTYLKKTISFFAIIIILFSFSSGNLKTYKCMIQMSNYQGEGAYISISLINPNGQYAKTLYVQGDDKEWYHELSSWWKFYGKKRTGLDGITGGTIAGGGRAVSVIKLDVNKINKGYKIRFESAVESKNYYADEVEIDLTTENLQKKFSGKGFIRYVRFLPQ
jgi:hypothetical protein